MNEALEFGKSGNDYGRRRRARYMNCVDVSDGGGGVLPLCLSSHARLHGRAYGRASAFVHARLHWYRAPVSDPPRRGHFHYNDAHLPVCSNVQTHKNRYSSPCGKNKEESIFKN